MVNPNSAHQRWSKWAWFVVPGRTIQRPFADVQIHCAHFGRKAFGEASRMKIRETSQGYIIEVLTEGHPVHDPGFVAFMRQNWQKFFEAGFGLGTTVKMTAKLMAGSRQNGDPADQMLVMPFITLN